MTMRPSDEEIATVLRPFAELANAIDAVEANFMISEWAISNGDLRAARDLLSRLEAQSGEKKGAGARIIESLKDAVEGNFASVTIDGQKWVRAGQHVAPPAPGSSSGRGIVARIAAECSPYEANLSAGQIAAKAEEIIDSALDDCFLSGRRSMQEEAAKVVEDAKAEFRGVDGWAAVAIKRIADAIRALNPETKP